MLETANRRAYTTRNYNHNRTTLPLKIMSKALKREHRFYPLSVDLTYNNSGETKVSVKPVPKKPTQETKSLTKRVSRLNHIHCRRKQKLRENPNNKESCPNHHVNRTSTDLSSHQKRKPHLGKNSCQPRDQHEKQGLKTLTDQYFERRQGIKRVLTNDSFKQLKRVTVTRN